MTTIEIYWGDLTPRAQQKIREALGLDENDDNNWMYLPMATIEIEDDDEKEE